MPPNVKTVNIEDEMKNSYLAYSMSVIVGRALPNARDGLKPVHRRALYSMYELGCLHNKPYKKSARIAGDCIGKYHPHGEGSVYLAFARFAQPWIMRYLLVDGQGNYGCFSGDTKVKLTDGRNLSFKDLVEENKQNRINYTYSYNFGTKKIEIAKILNPRLTKEKAKIAKVHLDDGTIIRCTYDHLFLLRDSTYIEAQNLTPETSLMPIYTRTSTNHKIVKVELTQETEDVYDLTINKTHNFTLSCGIFVHNSVDGDPCFTGDTKVKLADGRDLSFLELLAEQERGKIHYIFTYSEATKRIEIARFLNVRCTKKNAKIAKVYLDNGQIICCSYNQEFLLREGLYHKAETLACGVSLMPFNSKLSSRNGGQKIDGYEMVYQPNLQIWEYSHFLADEYNIARGVYDRSAGKVRHHLDFNKRNNSPDFDELVAQAKLHNHKICRVELTEELADVYDGEVEGSTKNFALSAGVFVHNCAAMRYTEARLSKIGELLLRDIDKETVQTEPNYDGSLQEPTVLPSVLPNLFLNGAEGIAVGMATSIPPHNLSELLDGIIYLIKHEDATIEELMKFVKGPDFPTGGFICGPEGIVQGYKTGRGKIKVRAKTHFEKNGNRDVIVADEIPFQVNKADLINKIAQLVSEKDPQNPTQRRLEGISDLRDESDKDGTRIVIELKRDANPEIVLNNLFEKTEFQSGFSFNCLAIVDNMPKMLSLKEALNIFIYHRRDVVARRTKYDLKKAQEKEHILLGLKIVTENSEKIVELIRKSKNSDEARTTLQNKFTLSEIQSKAILELQLRRLVILEGAKILEELSTTQGAIKEYNTILHSSDVLDDVIIGELEEVKKEFGDERKTKIIGATTEITTKDLTPDEEMVITLSHSGYVKRSSATLYRQQSRAGKGKTASGIKEDDFVRHMFVASTHDMLLVFSNLGRVYALNIFEIPEASRTAKGKAIVNLVGLKPEETISAVMTVKDFKPGHYLFFITKNGIVKKTDISEYDNIRASGLTVITIEEGDKLIGVTETDDQQQIILATKHGLMARFHEKNIRAVGRGAIGVRGIRLGENDEVVGFANTAKEDVELLVVSSKGFGKRTPLKEYRLINRGGKGVTGVRVTEKNGTVVGLLQVTGKEDVMLITNSGKLIRIKASDIRSYGRATVGVRLMTMQDGETLASATKIAEEDLEDEGVAAHEAEEKLTLFEEK